MRNWRPRNPNHDYIYQIKDIMHYVTEDEGFTSPNERAYILSRPNRSTSPVPLPPSRRSLPAFSPLPFKPPKLLQCFSLNLRRRIHSSCRSINGSLPAHPTRPLRRNLWIRLPGNKLRHHRIRVIKRHRSADIDFQPRHVARGFGVAVNLPNIQISLTLVPDPLNPQPQPKKQ